MWGPLSTNQNRCHFCAMKTLLSFLFFQSQPSQSGWLKSRQDTRRRLIAVVFPERQIRKRREIMIMISELNFWVFLGGFWTFAMSPVLDPFKTIPGNIKAQKIYDLIFKSKQFLFGGNSTWSFFAIPSTRFMLFFTATLLPQQLNPPNLCITQLSCLSIIHKASNKLTSLLTFETVLHCVTQFTNCLTRTYCPHQVFQ